VQSGSVVGRIRVSARLQSSCDAVPLGGSAEPPCRQVGRSAISPEGNGGSSRRLRGTGVPVQWSERRSREGQCCAVPSRCLPRAGRERRRVFLGGDEGGRRQLRSNAMQRLGTVGPRCLVEGQVLLESQVLFVVVAVVVSRKQTHCESLCWQCQAFGRWRRPLL
jgi:hypothetical protein